MVICVNAMSMRKLIWLWRLLWLPILLGNEALAEEIENFVLLDQHGNAVELHYYDYAPVVVLMAHRNDSDVVQQSASELVRLQQLYPQLEVFLVNSVVGQGRESIKEDAKTQDIELPILKDPTLLIGKSLQFEYAGESIVVDTKRWQVLYRGPVLSDLPATNGKQLVADVIDGFLTGHDSMVQQQLFSAAIESELLIDLASTHTEAISYSDTIAPLLVEKCVDCHRPGGIGPWAMTSHAIIQGFSPMIRETLLTKRMPPWHADPEVGHFKDDLSLSTDEIRQLVHWIDAGAPRGNGSDPLLAIREETSDWTLGEPDLIVSLPRFNVPATGVLDYANFEVKNPLDQDVWIKAVQIVPGDEKVVHHAIATFGPAGEGGSVLSRPQLMTFVPGNDMYVYPEQTGLLLPASSSFYTQMHYTTYGRETTDQTRIGLYFADEVPQHQLQHHAILDVTIDIPAGAANHEESAYYEIRHDAQIFALFPHAHYRGRSSEFLLRFPDGSEQLVLSIPNYDFNWQRYYQFKEPIDVPAGTKIIHRTRYDNSFQNERNPDPTIAVGFGEQSWDEMLYGGISFRYADPMQDDLQLPADQRAATAIGYLDRDMNGKVEPHEFPERMRDRLSRTFEFLDANETKGLEFEEIKKLLSGSLALQFGPSSR